jgi:hypothetical protein
MLTEQQVKMLNIQITRFEGFLNLDTPLNESIETRLMLCMSRVQKAADLLVQATTALGR